MEKRRPLVAGNWKMNGSRAESVTLLETVKRGISAASHAEVAVCPPFILTPLVAENWLAVPLPGRTKSERAQIGGVCRSNLRSDAMSRDYGCTYVIVGQ